MIHIDPAKVPKADEVRPLLFPGSMALSVDANGIQFVSREAFPNVLSSTSMSLVSSLFAPAKEKVHGAAPGAGPPAASGSNTPPATSGAGPSSAGSSSSRP